MKNPKFQYEEKYKKWLEMNPSEISQEVMRPVQRHAVVCLPKCIDTALNQMTEDEANRIIDTFICQKLEEIITLLLNRLAAKYQGGRENAEIQN